MYQSTRTRASHHDVATLAHKHRTHSRVRTYVHTPHELIFSHTNARAQRRRASFPDDVERARCVRNANGSAAKRDLVLLMWSSSVHRIPESGRVTLNCATTVRVSEPIVVGAPPRRAPPAESAKQTTILRLDRNRAVVLCLYVFHALKTTVACLCAATPFLRSHSVGVCVCASACVCVCVIVARQYLSHNCGERYFEYIQYIHRRHARSSYKRDTTAVLCGTHNVVIITAFRARFVWVSIISASISLCMGQWGLVRVSCSRFHRVYACALFVFSPAPRVYVCVLYVFLRRFRLRIFLCALVCIRL